MKYKPFALECLRLLDGPLKNAQELNTKYLLSLENDRLLFAFRSTAGLPTPGKPFGGWEKPDCEVRGHTLGHLLSALAMTYASTSNEEVLAKAKNLVDGLAECQRANGGRYLSGFPESFWDRLESLHDTPWAPFYTIHKMLQGLLDVVTYCGNELALKVLEDLVAYFDERIAKIHPVKWDKILDVEFGGVSEALQGLYEVTGKPEHLALAQKFDKSMFLGPLALEHDNLTGLHGNSHIPLVIAAAKRYELTGDLRYRKVAEHFWSQVAQHRTYATGGSTHAECWTRPDTLAYTLSTTNHECCKTYNMLRLTRQLLCWSGDVKYGDFYEQAFLNGIMGTQHPEHGGYNYYIPMLSGAHRVFSSPSDSFWCCVGTGMENWAKSADSVFFHDDHTLLVNLYLPCRVDWKEKDAVIEQRTNFPNEAGTNLCVKVKKPTHFNFRLRVPSWTDQGFAVQVNGQEMTVVNRQGYATISRLWENGDEVSISLPMKLSTWAMPDDPALRAVKFGPIVLAGLTGGEADPEFMQSKKLYQPAPEAVDTVIVGDWRKPDRWLEPVVGKALTFRTTSRREAIEFIPFNKVVSERYGIFWNVLSAKSPRLAIRNRAERRSAERMTRVHDSVSFASNECEAAHQLHEKHSSKGEIMGRSYRTAEKDGWYGYVLTLPEGKASLLCTFCTFELEPVCTDILVDGKLLVKQEVAPDFPGRFEEVEINLPTKMTDGKRSITVTFKATGATEGARLFGLATLSKR